METNAAARIRLGAIRVLLQTPQRSRKSQLLCNQANPNSSCKTPRVAYGAYLDATPVRSACNQPGSALALHHQSATLDSEISPLSTAFLPRAESRGMPVPPANSFIYRFYADSRSKPFIYRIYAKHPGGGGSASAKLRVLRAFSAPLRYPFALASKLCPSGAWT
jgi:hypothetical protein